MECNYRAWKGSILWKPGCGKCSIITIVTSLWQTWGIERQPVMELLAGGFEMPWTSKADSYLTGHEPFSAINIVHLNFLELPFSEEVKPRHILPKCSLEPLENLSCTFPYSAGFQRHQGSAASFLRSLPKHNVHTKSNSQLAHPHEYSNIVKIGCTKHLIIINWINIL